MSLYPSLISIVLATTPAMVLADGFSLARSLKHEKHVVISLTPGQVIQVGRERKLELTEQQKKTIKKLSKHVPGVLGVESLVEPDCGCCISSAMWTETTKVTIWIDRLAYDKDGSKFYFECRLLPGYFTMDSTGQIFAATKPVTWIEFTKDVRLRVRRGEPRHLSLPPIVPPDIQKRLDALPEKENPSGRM